MAKKINVLLVEDNPGDAFLLEEMLEDIPDFSFFVKKAETLKESLKTLEKEDFDIVLLDLGLPDSEHLDGLKAVLKLDKQIPVVVITGLNDNHVGRKAVELGAQSYMIKGEFSANSISQTIFHSIDRTKILKKMRKHENELKEKNKLLEEANYAQNLLISIISHDLRGPLNSITSLLEIINSEFDSIDEHSKKRYLKSILSSSKSTRDLMENLLEWAQIQSKRHKVEPENVAVSELMEEGIYPLLSIANEKDIDLNINKSENIEVFADKKMITTVIRNLVSNAIKFTPRSGQVDVFADTKIGEVVLFVKDTGVGMEKKTINSLFDMERTASTRGTEDEPGTGFGLILCKEFVEKNKGALHIDSELGKGTTIQFTLPVLMGI
jgi:signal transduction histidine kinase